LLQHRFIVAASHTIPEYLASCRLKGQPRRGNVWMQIDLPFCLVSIMVDGEMKPAPRQFFGFTYRYWRSIAALADGPVHI
jgi:hypothetical protein